MRWQRTTFTNDQPASGDAGTASKQLQLFEKLRSLASENELTELAVNNKSAVVRLYALQALKQNIKTVAQSVLEKFKSDTEEVVTLSGCFGDMVSVRRLAFEPIIQQQTTLVPIQAQ